MQPLVHRAFAQPGTIAQWLCTTALYDRIFPQNHEDRRLARSLLMAPPEGRRGRRPANSTPESRSHVHDHPPHQQRRDDDRARHQGPEDVAPRAPRRVLRDCLSRRGLRGSGAEADDTDGATAEDNQDLFAFGSRWSTSTDGITYIPVCWSGVSDHATEKEYVRSAVIGGWQSHSSIRFTGWGDCSGTRAGRSGFTTTMSPGAAPGGAAPRRAWDRAAIST